MKDIHKRASLPERYIRNESRSYQSKMNTYLHLLPNVIHIVALEVLEMNNKQLLKQSHDS